MAQVLEARDARTAAQVLEARDARTAAQVLDSKLLNDSFPTTEILEVLVLR
jgi:hypothetical protein